MSSAQRGLVARPATYAGLFVVTMSTLAYEIVLTRIFSVTMWYHFAFVAISVALFGTTLGALIVHLRPDRFTEDNVKPQMARFSLAYAIAVAVAFVAQLSVPFRIELDAVAIFSLVFICAVISVPFVCAGVVVCLALTKFPGKVNRLYAADLVGAGLGCLVLVAAFLWFDGPSLVILIAAIAAGGALLFAVDAKVRNLQVLAAVTMLVLLVGSVGNSMMASRRHEGFLKIRWVKEGEPDQPNGDPHLQDRWNAFSRVTVDGDPFAQVRPFGNGLSEQCPADDMSARQLSMVIDAAAATVLTGYTGDPDETDFLRCDISNVVYHALAGDDFDEAAVVGVGGGRDILSALEFDVGHVTGIEINGNILDFLNDTYGDFTGNLDQNPAVDFANDEARSWLTRSETRFDSIQISLIDTWAATAAGAFALSENSLYTTDAWHTFLDRLQPGGMLSVSRWFTTGNADPLEVLRTTALASEVLTDRGVENPRDHVIVLEGPPQPPFGFTVGTVLVSPEPFDDEVLERVDDVVDRYEFSPILTPDEATDRWDFAGLVAPGGPGPAVDGFEADISPPTDNQPFFFQMADLGDVLSGDLDGERHEFKPVITLTALGLAVLLIAAVCIGGPLYQIGRRTSHEGNVPYYLYFCGIGLGFLMVEISQLMRLSTFLGHPTYALVVVLFTVLLFSGLGSMVVDRISSLARPRSLVVPLLVLLGLAILFGMLTPRLIDSMDGETTPVRIGVAIGIMAPLAFLMGMPFSLGMRMASTKDDAPTAFLWGINGAMSVVASVFATVLALFFGIAVTFFTGVAAYVLAAAAMGTLVRRYQPAGAAPAPGEGPSDDAAEPADESAGAEVDTGETPVVTPAAT